MPRILTLLAALSLSMNLFAGDAAKAPPPEVLFHLALSSEVAGRRAQALDLLKRTLEAGYQLREVRVEPDLVQLRSDAAYHRLAAGFER